MRFHILVSVGAQREGAAETAVRWHKNGPEPALAVRNRVKAVLIATDGFGMGFIGVRGAAGFPEKLMLTCPGCGRMSQQQRG
jgi:hypothetical protein